MVGEMIVGGLGIFLGKICLPAAKEAGLFLKEIVTEWRLQNLQKMKERAEEAMNRNKIPEGFHAHPRIVHLIIDQSSWVDDSVVQDLWGGLLASSCNDNGQDESNLIFIKKLSSITAVQARILKAACEHSKKYVGRAGFIMPHPLMISLSHLIEITGVDDLHQLDTELDDLNDEGLLKDGGFNYHDKQHIVITPSPLAFHLYVRCQGSKMNPVDFFKIQPSISPEELDREITGLDKPANVE